ncbi:YbgC/FadM family acyl-CoA thioesterase [Novosphingobium sp. M1R2S20]|uniref:YbgC/FadM family acyl-CoA thioesterase n=1 Tax=Novosphingobium rhizovicinum TaxID=3228928 RepID=A0ABV3RDD6_9SPHN
MTELPQPAGGSIDGPVHWYALRVYYEDTDAGGIVYHANYLSWLERARSDMLEMLGVDQAASLAAGEGGYTVTEVTIRYRAPARLGDTVHIETRADKIGRSSSTLSQSAWCGETKLVDATVRVTFVGPDGRPRRQPDAWQKAFAEFAGGLIDGNSGKAALEGQE